MIKLRVRQKERESTCVLFCFQLSTGIRIEACLNIHLVQGPTHILVYLNPYKQRQGWG